MKKIQTRIPRPYGITQLSQEYQSQSDPHQKNKIKDKIVNSVIYQYLQSGLQLNKKPANVDELSTYLNIETTDVLRRLNKGMKKVGNILEGDQGLMLTRVILNRAIFGGLEIGALAEQQVRILLASQSGSYKPFISAEVNRSLANLISAHKLSTDTVSKLFEAIKMGQTGGQGMPNPIALVGPSHAQSQTQSGQFLNTEKALKLLEEKVPETALTNPDLKALIGPEEAAQLPEVKAAMQDLSAIGIRHNGAKKGTEEAQPNEKGTHHENRRQKEFDILDEEDLDEMA